MEDLSRKVAELRREYRSEPLDETQVGPDPLRQFDHWFREAVEVAQIDPEAMTLSTVDETGRVAGRIVLLKGYDARGFVFYTNYRSRKADELKDGSWAALTFYWAALNRQVRIEGRVARVSAEESDAYFATRPRGSQLGAWASPQSEEIASRAELDALLEAIEREYEGRQVPRPPHWGGYRVAPESVEFWQGRESRLHDRLLYTLAEDGHWMLVRLAP
jgi:pyridoxamine 5'-phosphate oxidase